MTAPLYDSLTAFSATNPLRMHMPGHKGIGSGLFSAIAQIDFTEIAPTGNLYTGEGPIAEAEHLCAAYAGAKEALFYTCGSTQGIHTMLLEAVGAGGHLILERGCHKSVYYAMALLDITPHYIYAPSLPDSSLSGPITPEIISNAIEMFPTASAVFLTSPTYYGIITDLTQISAVCHRHGLSLLVDQAHGAHFPALGLPSAPQQGADLSVVSTHKTWPALGSSSILYIGSDRFDKLHVKQSSTIFGTTSPSYPIMASIDYAREQLEQRDGILYRTSANLVHALRDRINCETPFHALVPTDGAMLDPCRLTIDVGCAGLSGYEADTLLQNENIYVEMADERYLVLILTCRDQEAQFNRLWNGITTLSSHCCALNEHRPLPLPPAPVQKLTIRQALFGRQNYIPLKDAAGQISGCILAPYPPGIPILAPGEEITEKHIAYLQKKSYNIEERIAVVSAADNS
ncbi:MAG: aminotransferase class V-fold PLP-dependent enzyme [Oscillospiraceae bacterium]|nr:aminotransferase class V-fold PLP-dependent enzyme [Oscillospiraceae bacterium]